jgi:hypothetical protein
VTLFFTLRYGTEEVVMNILINKIISPSERYMLKKLEAMVSIKTIILD